MKNTIQNVHGVKIGDIFYTSWGYDQTNIDYFEVVAVTAKMATVKPIESMRTETDFLQGITYPVPGAYIIGGFHADIIKTQTDDWGDGPRLKNADGCKSSKHIGYPYKGQEVRYSQYA